MTIVKDQNTPPRDQGSGAFQNQLAWVVFAVSAAGIIYSAWVASVDNNSKREIFNILVPLFGTWVGTILAFYFSKENFESANANLRQLVDKITPEQQLQKTSVSQVMKIRSAIKGITLLAGENDDAITIGRLKEVLDKGSTRVPIFGPGDLIKYVVHDSTLTKFIADKALSPTGFDPATVKFSEFLSYKIGNEEISTIVKKIAFVKSDATLADARAAMLAIKGCQDVFVTKNGRATEQVDGWLTNTDVTRDL